MTTPPDDRLLTSREVADIFRVRTKTVNRWAEMGLLTVVRAHPRAQRRYRESQVRELLGAKDN